MNNTQSTLKNSYLVSDQSKSSNTCPVCDTQNMKAIKVGVYDYVRCNKCKYELSAHKITPVLINNEVLSLASIQKKDLLESSKKQIVTSLGTNFKLLVDVGCAGGKFLFHSKDLFKKVIGIEASEASVKFAKSELGLNIVDSFKDIKETPSVVTFWHVLEHIPYNDIMPLLAEIKSISTKDTHVVVSVPSSDSLLYRLFGSNYTYFDPYAHVHQFTFESLERIFEKAGFTLEKKFYSFPYSAFGYLQTFLNLFNKIDNYMYYRKKRGQKYNLSDSAHKLLDLYNLILCGALMPIAFLGAAYDYFNKKSGAVITVSFKLSSLS